MHEDDAELRARLTGETGKLAWAELQRHFARGVVIKVAAELDLVDVALCMARDDADALQQWLSSGQVVRAGSGDAAEWHAREARFWAVVTAPWVLVQEIRGEA
jgi:hypothetical protein